MFDIRYIPLCMLCLILRGSQKFENKLNDFMRRLSRNSGASTCWNLKGLSRHVAGEPFFYLLLLFHCNIYFANSPSMLVIRILPPLVKLSKSVSLYCIWCPPSPPYRATPLQLHPLHRNGTCWTPSFPLSTKDGKWIIKWTTSKKEKRRRNLPSTTILPVSMKEEGCEEGPLAPGGSL